MRRWLPPVLAVLVAAGLLFFQLRRQSPARHVGDVAYGVRCQSCNTNYTLTTTQMNDLIDRGEVVSPPEEVRRFKCSGCGKMEATLDLTIYRKAAGLQEGLSMNRRSAFSLIELLAVVAIILILLCLLFPLFGLVRERSQTATCASNLRQIIAATNVYTSDHDGFYPDPWRWVWSDGSSGLWVEWAQEDTIPRGELYTGKYLLDKKIFLCPTFARVFGLNPAFSHLTPYVGYSMNEYMASLTGPSTWNGRAKVKRPQIINPATLGVFGDEGTVALPWGPVVINNLCLGVGDYKVPGSYCDALAAFHNMPGNDPTKGKGNVAFADGHAALSESPYSVSMFTPEQYK